MAAEQFDYVIVGAGSAGCVLANRLTETGRYRVLVLEAGGRDTNPWIHIPVGYGKHFLNPEVNWSFANEPEAATANRAIPQPRGKVLGGSSSINGLLYVRGHAEDYNHWRQLGCVGWSYDDVLPYFKKAENQENGADEYHGTGGPLSVSNPRDKHPIVEAYLEAAVQAGYGRTKDFNGAQQEGFGYYQTTTRDGMRWSAAKGYLHPAMKRSNLKVETNALASRVLFEGKRAVGVEYLVGNDKRTVRASVEVICSLGALNSPQLLMLSGLGPADQLKKYGIPVIADIPAMGRDMQDHYAARTVWRARTPLTLNDMTHSLTKSVVEGTKFALQRRGMLTVGAASAGGFICTRPGLAQPDVQVHIMLFSTDKLGTDLHDFPGVTTPILLLRPHSTGYVELRSADPHDSPKIHGGYLTAQRDCDVMIAGMRAVRRIMQQHALKPHIVSEHEPGLEAETDDAILAYMREKGNTAYHPTTTCRMGNDDRAVVDERLRVKGFTGLRVVDASIMPTVVSGNTNAPTIMIAEKAADMIQADARKATQAA
jgi:choline dehydrogenase